MFKSCKKLTTVPLYDLSNARMVGSMFHNCIALTEIPQFNLSNATSTRYMFITCENLETIPQLDISKVTDAEAMFSACYKVKEISLITSGTITNTVCMFQYCKKLETVGVVDMVKVTKASNMFQGCNVLTNLTLLNIKVDLQIGSGTLYGDYLTLESLINTIKELVNTGSTKTLTIGSANLEKIANVYVRRTTEGDIPTYLSDNSNIDLAKAPCEVCNADDEGAMSIIAYANSKNWTLA
jgi:hypothetical protein